MATVCHVVICDVHRSGSKRGFGYVYGTTRWRNVNKPGFLHAVFESLASFSFSAGQSHGERHFVCSFYLECECHGHAQSCHFSQRVWNSTRGASGGVCDACQHNTVGRRCQRCSPGYHRLSARAIDSPQACTRKRGEEDSLVHTYTKNSHHNFVRFKTEQNLNLLFQHLFWTSLFKLTHNYNGTLCEQ